MNSSAAFAARLLETSASAYAGVAASLLLERQPGVADRYAPSALKDWQSHLQCRIMELSAALCLEDPILFSSRIRWAGQAFRARALEEGDLHSGLSCLRDVLFEDLPNQARAVTVEYLESALQTLDEAPSIDAGLDPSNPLERRALEYLEAALEGAGRRAIDLVVGAVDGGLSIRQGYEILLCAQREVGRLWHLGEVEVAEEHLVTSIAERAAAVLAQRATSKASNGKTVVLAAVAENRHSFAARVLADFFEIEGWRAICLGADVPNGDVATAVVYFDADLLALTISLSTQLQTAQQVIETVHSLPGRDVKILVGGGVFAESPSLWQRLGADAFRDEVDTAVSVGQDLVGI